MGHIAILPTGSACGAEVRCGAVQTLDAADFGIVRRAWVEHLVLVFRDQQLDDAALVEFAARFGPPMTEAEFARGAPARAAVHVVSNAVGVDGAVGLYGSGDVAWHSDMVGFDVPPAASLLHALEIPPAGGETYFMNMYLAWETLPRDLATRLAPLALKHAVARDSASPGTGAVHPLVCTHPESGCNVLFPGSRENSAVVGLPAAESAALLDRLWTHLVQWRFIWKHAWRRGDLLVWDNRCLLHARSAFAPAARRILHRVQVRAPSRPATADDARDRPPHVRTSPGRQRAGE